MHRLLQDIKYGMRTLLQRPGFTIVAVVALALAVGASSAMFSVVNAVILKPLNFDDFDNVAIIWECERLSAIPGVTQVGANNVLPLSGGSFMISYAIADGRPPVPPQDQASGAMRFITPGYFPALKVPLVSGRAFTAQDRATAPPVIIINEALARREFPKTDPLGKQMAIGYSNGPAYPPRTIVGVVRDMKITSIRGAAEPQYYVPFAQLPFSSIGLIVVAAVASYLPARRATRVDPLIALRYE